MRVGSSEAPMIAIERGWIIGVSDEKSMMTFPQKLSLWSFWKIGTADASWASAIYLRGACAVRMLPVQSSTP